VRLAVPRLARWSHLCLHSLHCAGAHTERLGNLQNADSLLELLPDPRLDLGVDPRADKLGSELDFVRVDMYKLNGRIVFGEFTNYPGAGLDQFYPHEFDELFGSKWRWPPCDT
jgi:TupA-like ATPgrasp